ncbi:mandelate racemase/muconate lactonizing enzyme family protein [Hyperthermus butylicus]|uniref:Muconate cycloisomerase I n=1 Tax=Hyperthermus butylicus (strain DSM 5456 / JCM 9403 / PLM1-5) TaxID=415426 RepID=A2BKM9_HYPBU|nr:dipeptide epimerase [Hyperthermus butylicus]ABM80540.1 Muconate cycloisomerase I [Hyperthermus butylicus DSM 5456]
MPRISRVEYFVVEARIRGVFRIAYSAASVSRSVVVKVVLEDGTIGFGEASPSKMVTWETIDSIGSYVGLVSGQLRGLSLPEEMGKALRVIHGYGLGFSSARAALESAILDAVGKLFGVPVYNLLGGRVAERLVTDYTVSIPDLGVARDIAGRSGRGWELYAETIEYIVGLRSKPPEEPPIPVPSIQGFNVLKVKVGTGDPLLDAQLVLAAYEASRGRARIRVDANQAWSPKEAVRVIHRLENTLGDALELVEQPVPAWNLEGLRYVKERVDVPIAADESARSPVEAARVAAMGAADVINIKIAKAGGPLQAARIASLAEAHGLQVMWGCMAETGLGIAQALHAALTSTATRYVDLDSPLFLEKDPARNSPRYRATAEGVTVEPAPGPGLATEI